MSICVSVKVGEGLVFAADSAITLTAPVEGAAEGTVQIQQIYAHGNKISQVGSYPMGVATWGQGAVGDRTVSSLFAEFSEKEAATYREAGGTEPDWTVERVAGRLYGFVKGRYETAFAGMGVEVPSEEGPPLGLLIGGYGATDYLPSHFAGLLPINSEPGPARVPDPASFGANWYGATDAILRLYKGFSPEIPQRLLALGLDQKQAEDALSGLEYPVAYDSMPLQDAVDFAMYLVSVVIGRFHFVAHPAICGGEIDVAVMTPQPREFTWIQRKDLRARSAWHGA